MSVLTRARKIERHLKTKCVYSISINMFSGVTLTKGNTYLEFTIQDVDLAVVNAIRRIILSEIPNVAIGFDPFNPDQNDIDILVNQTALHNEFLGHRISLLPVCFDEATIDAYDPLEYAFEIKVTNTTNEPIDVTTKDIQVLRSASGSAASIMDGEPVDQALRDAIFPVNAITNDPILITRLKPSQGEQLHVRFRARKGIARTHARWSPVSLCTYEFVVDDKAAKAALDELMGSDEAKDAKQRAILKNRFETLDRQKYYVKNDKHEPSMFQFKVESECRLSPVSIVNKAWTVLKDKVARLQQAMNAGTGTGVDTTVCRLDRINELDDFYAWTIFDEDHTLGNLLQSMLFNLLVPSQHLTFIGYHQPHPLERTIVIKLKFPSDHATPTDVLTDGLRQVMATLDTLTAKWQDVTSATTAASAAASAVAAAPPPPKKKRAPRAATKAA